VKIRSSIAFVLAAGISVVPALASNVRRAPTSGHSHTKHHAPPASTTSHKLHGQQAIDSQRVTEIQQALIREHYLTGEPSSKWDSGTQAAMLKFQADQGWQTKITPDSRALIKLGLGPNHSDAINAGSGVNFNTLTTPASAPASSTAPTPSVQGFAAASGVSQ
jgi:hypothetical protein